MITQKDDKKLLDRFGRSKNLKHFIIEDASNEVFSIVAYYYLVSNNNLQLLESSLGDFFWSNNNHIFFDSDKGSVNGIEG